MIEEVRPKDPHPKMTEIQSEHTPLQSWRAQTWLQKLWPAYCLLVIAAAFGYARFDPYQIDGDAVSYMDIGDLIRTHQWAGVVNGYWHPLYPAALALGRTLFHSTRYNELHAYYIVNLVIFLLEMLAIVAFTDAMVRLRDSRGGAVSSFLLGRYPLRYLCLGLLVIASQRELSIGKIRPDALLQVLLLFGFAALLTHLSTLRLRYAALMGAVFGLAFLTKSFAFPVTLLSVALLAAFGWLWQRRPVAKIVAAAAVALACFALIAGPYIAALSRQKGRLNFGESGSLNYAWYVGGTEKMHLQNGTPAIYGTSDVHLKHPERLLLASPVVTSYEPFAYGTYPPWFDATYFNDTIRTHINPGGQIRVVLRNIVLVVRYLLNHPEGWLLLLLLILLGARPDLCRRLKGNGFWIVPLLLGIAIFAIYGMVNVEERYVTVGWLCILLTLFASLHAVETVREGAVSIAAALILMFAILATGESFRRVFEMRRLENLNGTPDGWYNPAIFGAARALNDMGVGPGDAIACAGSNACLFDHYWARLAGVRITSEIYLPGPRIPVPIDSIPNLPAALAAVRGTGANFVVAYFDPDVNRGSDPANRGWVSLGDTNYYVLRLNPAVQKPKLDSPALP